MAASSQLLLTTAWINFWVQSGISIRSQIQVPLINSIEIITLERLRVRMVSLMENRQKMRILTEVLSKHNHILQVLTSSKSNTFKRSKSETIALEGVHLTPLFRQYARTPYILKSNPSKNGTDPKNHLNYMSSNKKLLLKLKDRILKVPWLVTMILSIITSW